eukprot:scaffold11097_cov116-Isochrysis_galbana.AAC.6
MLYSRGLRTAAGAPITSQSAERIPVPLSIGPRPRLTLTRTAPRDSREHWKPASPEELNLMFVGALAPLCRRRRGAPHLARNRAGHSPPLRRPGEPPRASPSRWRPFPGRAAALADGTPGRLLRSRTRASAHARGR